MNAAMSAFWVALCTDARVRIESTLRVAAWITSAVRPL